MPTREYDGTMGRILGIDYGLRRIGLAIADDETRIAMPLATLGGRNDPTRDARNVTDRGAAEEAAEFVVGLPLSMDGSDSEQTRLTRRFEGELARLSGKAVHLQDERLSSYTAEQKLEEAGVSGRRARKVADQVAAQQILQAWLDLDEHPKHE